MRAVALLYVLTSSIVVVESASLLTPVRIPTLAVSRYVQDVDKYATIPQSYSQLAEESNTNYTNDIPSSELTRADYACLINAQCTPSNVNEMKLKIQAVSANDYSYSETTGSVRLSMNLFAPRKYLTENLENELEPPEELIYEDEFGERSRSEVTTSKHWLGMPSTQSSSLTIRKLVYIFPIKLPCWVRWIHIRFLGQHLRFPRFGWGRTCCKVESGLFGWFSNSSGCYEGTGPFLNEAQCVRTCRDTFDPPPPPPNNTCTLGNGTIWDDGHQETDCAGTTCECINGTIQCQGCRHRYEIHDAHGYQPTPDVPTEFEQRVVDSLLWVSQGCTVDGVQTCPGWLINSLQNHLAYGGVAHGNSQFFPWHRAYLKTLEIQMQKYDPCVTIPYWDWTLDQVKTNGDFGWTDKMDSGNEQGVWGHINGNQSNMGEFGHDGNWTIPSSWPVASRSIWMNPGSSLPSTATIVDYLARIAYDIFKAFEGPHGSPHVMIGGNMGNGRSPADPIFWIHHAGVDKLWYDWQLLHTANDYDADPSLVLEPFSYSPNDVFDSENSLGVCYAAANTLTPVPPTGSRRATAVEYGLIASLQIISGISLNKDFIANAASASKEANRDACSVEGHGQRQPKQTCGGFTECLNCLMDETNDASTGQCLDMWLDAMQMDPESVARDNCTTTMFGIDMAAEFNETTDKTQVASVGDLLLGPNKCNEHNAGTCVKPEVWSKTLCKCHTTAGYSNALRMLNQLEEDACKDLRSAWGASNCKRTCPARK